MVVGVQPAGGAARRAWLGFRDAECSFAASSVSGGSIYPMIFGECLAGLTAARAVPSA
jgi:uncharacterized protein YecT (DUF1311 family)